MLASAQFLTPTVSISQGLGNVRTHQVRATHIRAKLSSQASSFTSSNQSSTALTKSYKSSQGISDVKISRKPFTINMSSQTSEQNFAQPEQKKTTAPKFSLTIDPSKIITRGTRYWIENARMSSSMVCSEDK